MSPTFSAKPVVWRLRAGADRRFRAGHPWIYSNELAESPKGIEPGQPVEIRDAGGKFLARGYGNPKSLISFRALSRDEKVEKPDAPENLLATLQSAGKLREIAGLTDWSHRLCFGEADFLPGLVIDRYRTNDSQIFVIQAHTAGADRWLGELPGILAEFNARAQGPSWEKTALVLRNDLAVRSLEGLTEEAPRILKEVPGLDLAQATIRIRPAAGRPEFHTDLLQGQKTGFFLDQAGNIQMAAQRLGQLRPSGKSLRILDLCCYVGQWSAQLAAHFRAQGVDCHATAVDASQKSLGFARRNLEAREVAVEILRADVLKDLGTLESQSFDLVISDPPALIQGRKDIPAGTHAYLQLNTQVFRLVRPGGAVISCSCSGLLEEDEFLKTLSKAARRNQVAVRWIGRGANSPDHPALVDFPEGRYLKCWIGVVS